MKWPKLTAFTACIFTAFILNSCQPDDITESGYFVGSNLPMNGAQETPPISVPATGTINATYSNNTKVLNFTIDWSGLSGLPVAAHIHGTGTAGYAAGVVKNLWTAPNATLYPASGSYSGSMFVDGVHLKEEHLLAGAYYINIHTQARPAGEIRGQIILTRSK